MRLREDAYRREGGVDGVGAAGGDAAAMVISKRGALAKMEAQAAVGNAKGLGRRDDATGRPVENQYVHVEGKLGVDPEHDVIGGGGNGRQSAPDSGGLTLGDKVARNRRGSLVGVDLSGTRAIEAAAAMILSKGSAGSSV